MKEIKKGKITMTVIIGIMCFILVYIMFMQFKVVNQTDITSLTTKRESELREELDSWQSKYEDTANQLEQAKTNLEEYKNAVDSAKLSEDILSILTKFTSQDSYKKLNNDIKTMTGTSIDELLSSYITSNETDND